MMKTSELDYDLPPERIAQEPCEPRDASRLLIVDRATHCIHEAIFRDLPSYLHCDDCLVINNTRVIRARLHGVKATGGRVEVFLLEENQPGEWIALVKPSAKVKPGTHVRFTESVEAEVGERLPSGRRMVRFAHPDVIGMLERLGEIPLPPYVHREQEDSRDAERYQTVYAQSPGAVAAPTAGLHFTPHLLNTLETAGIHRVSLTLHVGYGTFKPIQTEDVASHQLEEEWFELSDYAADTLNRTRRAGGRIIAVGTTSTRTLETQWHDGCILPGSGRTGHYIYPPYSFHAVDALITNFHLPRTSLLALVCAFADKDLILEAYQYAIHEGFRFYSYGDAMLIL